MQFFTETYNITTLGYIASGGFLVFAIINLIQFLMCRCQKCKLIAVCVGFPASFATFVFASYTTVCVSAVVMLCGMIVMWAFRNYKSIKNATNEALLCDLKSSNERLEKQIEDLTKSNETKDKFFSIVAHDIKNPTSSIKMISEMFLEIEKNNSDSKAKDLAESLNISVDSLFKLMESLLTWSRAQLGKISFEPLEIDVNDVINELKDSLYPLSETKKIELRFKNKCTSSIYADSNMLQSILRNLITNAIKFSYENGSVEIEFKENQDSHIITVADNGVGMTQDAIDKLFKIDCITSTHGTSYETGSGLGLIISQEFADYHKGNISVKSEKGLGSVFTVTFPKNNKPTI